MFVKFIKKTENLQKTFDIYNIWDHADVDDQIEHPIDQGDMQCSSISKFSSGFVQ